MGTIFNELADDHVLTDTLFARACRQVRASDFAGAGVTLAALRATFERHLRLEETVLFDAAEQALAACVAMTAVLRAEHRNILGVLSRMAASAEERDRLGFLKHACTLRTVLQQHHEKEEKAFYPVVERLLARQPVPGLAEDAGRTQ